MTQHIHPNLIETALRYERARLDIAQPEEEHIDSAPIYAGKNYSDCRLTQALHGIKNHPTHTSMIKRGLMEPFIPGVNNEEGD
jgi:hypothetical protein